MEFKFHRIELRALSRLIIALLIMPVSIAAEGESSSLGRVVVPDPATPANAQECVEPVDVMRRDHMKFLLHQRDDTVLDGIRTKKYSLTGCVNCHAQAGSNGEIVRAEDPGYFCTECHTYAAVKIDCFECHSDRAAEITTELELSNPRLAPIYADVASGNPQHSRLHQTLLQQVEIRVEQ